MKSSKEYVYVICKFSYKQATLFSMCCSHIMFVWFHLSYEMLHQYQQKHLSTHLCNFFSTIYTEEPTSIRGILVTFTAYALKLYFMFQNNHISLSKIRINEIHICSEAVNAAEAKYSTIIGTIRTRVFAQSL